MPAEALERLLEGNRRYVASMPTLDESEFRRIQVARGQRPFAAVFGCVDSRVPPEIIFDQGLGDLLVIRTAGQVVDKAVLGSLEFGVAELDIPVVVVLGHERCGAVKAAMEVLERHGHAEAEIDYLVGALQPAIHKARVAGDNVWDNAARAHIEFVVDQLGRSAILGKAVQNGALRIVPAWYDLDTGIVEMGKGLVAGTLKV